MENKRLFALDIGTRSVVGLVGELANGTIRLMASQRQEHHTRAMLDGQIHDVPEVAAVLGQIKTALEETCGPLKEVSVAAAGRALCTITATAEMEMAGVITAESERSLELAAIQTAQHSLATSNAVADPTLYYCVGYSTIGFTLDGTSLKTIVGQRGKSAAIEIIATFLPRQVIDSMQAALQQVGLEMASLTLEPIAAINVLIPPTMRHLNLALVDVGAGTSDVAITRDGSVIGYGMVPCAGDEITEAISQKYLLDFNVAETVKRQLLGKQKKISFSDVLGMTQKVNARDIIQAITTTVAELSQSIAAQILALNHTPPQAVLLVGGGSLTPLLPQALAQALDIPDTRVAIRCPEAIDGLSNIDASLKTPDSVTPLGILKLSSSQTLNFVNITLNDKALRLFNLGSLTVADALLYAGIDIRTLHGKPGMGITVKINGKTKFIAGSMGQSGTIHINGTLGTYTDPLTEGDILTVTKGTDGITPDITLSDLVNMPADLSVRINENQYRIKPRLTINNAPADGTTKVADRDDIICDFPAKLEEVLHATGLSGTMQDYSFIVNGTERSYRVCPSYTLNGKPATGTATIKENDSIAVELPAEPTLAELLGIRPDDVESISISFNKSTCLIPVRRYTLSVNSVLAKLTDIVKNGSFIEYSYHEQLNPMISDVLLAAEFNPSTISPTSKVQILLNSQPAEYTSIVKNGDAIDIVIS